MKRLTWVFLCLLVFAFWLNANPVAWQTRTITGNKCYSMIGSSGRGDECVSTASGKVCYDITARTKRVGFGSDPDHPSYSLGAEYTVTLSGTSATKIVFTGNVKKSTSECEPD